MPGYTNLNHPPPAAPSLLLPASRALEPSSSTPSIAALLLSTRNKRSGSRRQQAETATAAPARALPTMRRATLPLALGLSLVAFFAARGADASIHEYAGGGFAPRANSFFFHGGSEGLYASDPSSNSSASFIRYTRLPPHPPGPHSLGSTRLSPRGRAPKVLRIAYASRGCWWAGSDETVECGAFR